MRLGTLAFLATLASTAAQAESVYCDLVISGPEGSTPTIVDSFTEVHVSGADEGYIVDGKAVVDFQTTTVISVDIEETETDEVYVGVLSIGMTTTCRIVTVLAN